jgi:ADP-ribosylglycohydrolase
VVDTLNSAVQAMEAGSYEAVVKTAIQFGNDTDTTACVAGGVAGLRHGLQAIPPHWLEALRGKELVEPFLKALVSRVGMEHLFG